MKIKSTCTFIVLLLVQHSALIAADDIVNIGSPSVSCLSIG